MKEMKTKVTVHTLSEFQQVAKRIGMKLDLKALVLALPTTVEFYSPGHTVQDSEIEEMSFEEFKKFYMP